MSPIQPTPKALVVGISGPSSSGKTTLARLLQRIFCGVTLNVGPESETEAEDKLNTFIIHEDDFYYPDDQYELLQHLLFFSFLFLSLE